MKTLIQISMEKSHGKGKSKSAERRRKENLAVLHHGVRGDVIVMSDRTYKVAPDGSFRRMAA